MCLFFSHHIKESKNHIFSLLFAFIESYLHPHICLIITVVSLHISVCVYDDITIHFYMMRANQKFIIIIGGVKCNKKVFFLLAFDEMRNVMSQNESTHTHGVIVVFFTAI